MQKTTFRTRYLALGAVTGLVGSLYLYRKLSAPVAAPYLKTWQHSLAARLGPAKAARITAQVQSTYEQVYAARTRYRHPALRLHLERKIIPGLALYWALLSEFQDQETALHMTGELLQEIAWEKSLAPLMVRLPGSFNTFRWILRVEMAALYPRAGWRMRWLQDDENVIDFHIYQCFYHNVLTAYGAPELTPMFCRLDDVLGEALAPTIQWRRLYTIGRGDEVCDFCFRKARLERASLNKSSNELS